MAHASDPGDVDLLKLDPPLAQALDVAGVPEQSAHCIDPTRGRRLGPLLQQSDGRLRGREQGCADARLKA